MSNFIGEKQHDGFRRKQRYGGGEMIKPRVFEAAESLCVILK